MKVDLFAIPPDEPARYFPGDQELRRWVRRVLEPIRDRPPNGLTKVAINLALGFKQQGVDVRLFTRYRQPRHGAYVGIVNCPPRLARLIANQTDCLVGPGVLNVPDDWPDMMQTSYRVKAYLQACEWQANVFRGLYGADAVKVWPVGIDTDYYKPDPNVEKRYDLMIYDKRRWPMSPPGLGVLEECLDIVSLNKLTYKVITYGKYGRGGEKNFENLARQSRAMLFICENETQGIAYNQVLSLGLPVIAWDQASWCDPCRSSWGLQNVDATSIPYWSAECGEVFHNTTEFASKLPAFIEAVHQDQYSPREYVLRELNQEKQTAEYSQLLTSLCTPFSS